jgi:hypothetical protein
VVNGCIRLQLAIFGVLMSSPEAAGLASHDLTVPLQVADASDSVHRAPPTRGKGTNPTCFDSDSVL